MNLQAWLKEKRGRSTALAGAIDISVSVLSRMAAGEKPVPLDHCPFIEEFTGGEVTCEELRPDKASYFALLREQAGRRGIQAAPVAAQGVA